MVDYIDSDMTKDRFFHGTSEKYLDDILKNGLKPRGDNPAKWSEEFSSGSDRVYLTTSSALIYAKRAAEETGTDPVIIEVDPNKVLVPDEDYLYICSSLQYYDSKTLGVAGWDDGLGTDWAKELSFLKEGKYKESRDDTNGINAIKRDYWVKEAPKYYWLADDSISRLHSCAQMGVITPDRLLGHITFKLTDTVHSLEITLRIDPRKMFPHQKVDLQQFFDSKGVSAEAMLLKKVTNKSHVQTVMDLWSNMLPIEMDRLFGKRFSHKERKLYDETYPRHLARERFFAGLDKERSELMRRR